MVGWRVSSSSFLFPYRLNRVFKQTNFYLLFVILIVLYWFLVYKMYQKMKIVFPLILPNGPKHCASESFFFFTLVPVLARLCIKHKQFFLSPNHSLGPEGDMYCKAILTLVHLTFYDSFTLHSI